MDVQRTFDGLQRDLVEVGGNYYVAVLGFLQLKLVVVPMGGNTPRCMRISLAVLSQLAKSGSGS